MIVKLTMEGASGSADTPKEEKPAKSEGGGGDGGGGVAQKDIDKIAKLKEFMAKQQIDEKDLPRSYRGSSRGRGRGRGDRHGMNGVGNF